MIDESKKRLREYIEEDKIYQDYKNSGKEPSDFERFCFVHCRDIENVLNELEQLKEENKKLKEKYNIRSKSYNNILLENASLHTVLDEIREYIKEKEKDGTLWTVKATDDLLQILDKVKE